MCAEELLFSFCMRGISGKKTCACKKQRRQGNSCLGLRNVKICGIHVHKPFCFCGPVTLSTPHNNWHHRQVMMPISGLEIEPTRLSHTCRTAASLHVSILGWSSRLSWRRLSWSRAMHAEQTLSRTLGLWRSGLPGFFVGRLNVILFCCHLVSMLHL